MPDSTAEMIEDGRTLEIGHWPALSLIDKFLPTLASRELVSSAEVTDLLLDIRSSLTS